MSYNSDYEENEDAAAGEPQETDGINRGDDMGASGSDAQKKFGNEDIASEIKRFLMTPRFTGDTCITFNMPDAVLKKARDKINLALWNAYKKYARTVERTDRNGNVYKVPGFGMHDIVMTLVNEVDPQKFAQVLDIEIKQKIAEELNIKISDDELEYVAKHPVDEEKKKRRKAGEVECPVCCGMGKVHGTEVCPLCAGTGTVKQKVADSIIECPICHGVGTTDEGDVCPMCLGGGFVQRIIEDIPDEAAGTSVEEQIDSMDIDIEKIETVLEAAKDMKNGGLENVGL